MDSYDALFASNDQNDNENMGEETMKREDEISHETLANSSENFERPLAAALHATLQEATMKGDIDLAAAVISTMSKVSVEDLQWLFLHGVHREVIKFLSRNRNSSNVGRACFDFLKNVPQLTEGAASQQKRRFRKVQMKRFGEVFDAGAGDEILYALKHHISDSRLVFSALNLIYTWRHNRGVSKQLRKTGVADEVKFSISFYQHHTLSPCLTKVAKRALEVCWYGSTRKWR